MINAIKKGLYSLLLILILGTSLMADKNLESSKEEVELATFAGGCFWCLEHTFDVTAGVIDTTVGYSGGEEVSPTYRQVAGGQTTHRESIQVKYYPSKVSYRQLLHNFFLEHDPYDGEGQFVDRGSHYAPAAFYHNEEQRQEIINYIAKLKDSQKVKTEVLAYKNFYPAEEYHQDFYQKNPDYYSKYRVGSGRDKKLEEIWGK